MAAIHKVCSGGQWRALFGAAAVPVKPSAPAVVGVTASTGQVQVSWSPPRNSGGSAITGYTVTVEPGGHSITVGQATRTATVTGLIDGVDYAASVAATNAQGSTAATPTPFSYVVLAAKPSVSNTGVPVGLPGDSRPPESLTVPPGVDAGRLEFRNVDGSALSGGWKVYDHADFTNVRLIFIGTNKKIRFTRCRFRLTSFIESPLFLMAGSGSGVSVTDIEFIECTFDGNTANPYLPVKSLWSTLGLVNAVLRRCNLYGFNDCLQVGALNGIEVDACWLHDMNKDKSQGYVKSITGTPTTGGSLAPGTYTAWVRAVSTRTGTAVAETVSPPQPATVTVASADNAVSVTWAAYSAAAGRTTTGYRVFIGTNGPGGAADGFIEVAGAATTSLLYTGQALSPLSPLAVDSSAWAHADCMQLGNVSFAHNIWVHDSFLDATAHNAVFQIGSTQTVADLSNIVVEDNWCDGGSYAFNLHSGKPTNAQVTNLAVRNNRIGRASIVGVFAGTFRTVADDLSGNVWDSTGPLTSTGAEVLEGALVP